MADLAKVKRNIQRMIDQKAPEAEIDAYVASEGTTPDELKAFKAPANSVAGTLKALGSGAAKGAMSIGGAVGDAQQMSGDAAQWLAQAMGAPENWQGYARTAGEKIAFPGITHRSPRTAEITAAQESLTGPLYKPQTTQEGYAETIGEFAPAALSGPGGLLRKGAMTVLPAVASEAAENVTSNTGLLGKVAGPAAGLLTAVAAPAVGRKLLQKTAPALAQHIGADDPLATMRRNAPSLTENKAVTDDAYQALRDAGIQYSGNKYKSFAQKTAHQLRTAGWRPRDSDIISADLKDILSRINKPNSYEELESMRRGIGNLPTNASKTDIRWAEIIKKNLDTFMNDAGNVVSSKNIPRDQLEGMYKFARERASRNIKARQIGEMEEAKAGYLGGDESAMRNQFGGFLRNPRKRAGLSPLEKKTYGQVVRREGLLNAGHLLGSRWGQIAGGSSSSVIGGLLGNFILPGAGAAVGAVAGPVANLAGTTAFRKVMEKVTDKKVKDALETVLAGRAAQTQALNRAQQQQLSARIQELIALSNSVRSSERLSNMGMQ